MILPVEGAVVLLRRHSRPGVLDEVAAEKHTQRSAIPRSSGPLRRVRAVIEGAAVSAEPHIEQAGARVVVAVVIEWRRSPELFAGQLSLGIVLSVG